MNAECAQKSLDVLASCLAASERMSHWLSIVDECAEVWQCARLVVECASSGNHIERPKWLLDFEETPGESGDQDARLAILVERGFEAARALEVTAAREPAVMPVALAAFLLFRVAANHPDSLSGSAPSETAKLIAQVNTLFHSNSPTNEKLHSLRPTIHDSDSSWQF